MVGVRGQKETQSQYSHNSLFYQFLQFPLRLVHFLEHTSFLRWYCGVAALAKVAKVSEKQAAHQLLVNALGTQQRSSKNLERFPVYRGA